MARVVVRIRWRTHIVESRASSARSAEYPQQGIAPSSFHLQALFTILTAFALVLCARHTLGNIAQDIHFRSAAALEEAGIPPGPMLVDGVDVTLLGSQSSPQVGEAARTIVQNVAGVRSVQVRIDAQAATGPPAAPSPAEPAPITGPPRPGVLFETGSTSLAAGSAAALEPVAAYLAGHPNVKLSIEGHTDSEGNEGANLILSQMRAEAVRLHLLTRGAARSQLSVAGYGSSRPIAGNTTADGRAKNRRIEFHYQDAY